MIRKSIFTLMFLAVMGWVSAQSLQYELNGVVYSEGETVVCNTPNEWGEYLQEMQLRNLTGQDMNVLVEKEVIEDLEGVTNYFCWGSCFGPNVVVSPDPVPVAANSLTGEGALSFHAMFDETVYGKIQVKYYAYDERHPEEKISIIVIFRKSGEGLNEMPAAYFGQPYPNPANSMVSFDYNLSGSYATAVVYNLVGQEVMRQELNPYGAKLSLSVADLNDGIYFCSVLSEGKTLSTVKFVVKK